MSYKAFLLLICGKIFNYCSCKFLTASEKLSFIGLEKNGVNLLYLQMAFKSNDCPITAFLKQTQHYQSVSLLRTGNVHDTFIASVESRLGEIKHRSTSQCTMLFVTRRC